MKKLLLFGGGALVLYMFRNQISDWLAGMGVGAYKGPAPTITPTSDMPVIDFKMPDPYVAAPPLVAGPTHILTPKTAPHLMGLFGNAGIGVIGK